MHERQHRRIRGVDTIPLRRTEKEIFRYTYSYSGVETELSNSRIIVQDWFQIHNSGVETVDRCETGNPLNVVSDTQ